MQKPMSSSQPDMKRLITPDAPCLTLGQVTHPDLLQAFLAADALVRANPTMKGVVLHRPDTERAAIPNYLPAHSKLAQHYHSATISTGHKLNLSLIRTSNPDAPFGVYCDVYEQDRFNAAIDLGRMDELSQLSRLFAKTNIQMLSETEHHFGPHFDAEGFGLMSDSGDDDCLFWGRQLRYLRVWQGHGTLIYDGAHTYEAEEFDGIVYVNDASPEAARILRNGDILLFFDALWGSKRALPHSGPDFNAALNDGQPRLLDNIDLIGGRKLSEIRAELSL